MFDAVKFNVPPSQSGELLVAVGATGAVVTVTAVVPAALGHPATVATTEYVPVAAVVAEAILGF